jgi:hypothetical protein
VASEYKRKKVGIAHPTTKSKKSEG